MRSRHYADGSGLYRALRRILDPKVYDLSARDIYVDEEYRRRRDEETRAILAEFLEWFGKTGAGDGLTSEREADFRAREEMGVRVTLDRSGALVIRVPRGKMEDGG
jgi:hypothetical protein